jgi:spore maturation protein CgeB
MTNVQVVDSEFSGLFIGSRQPSSTSLHRFRALQRIGINVALIDPRDAIADALQHPISSRIHYRTGYRLLQRRMTRWLETTLSDQPVPHFVWVDGGEFLGTECLQVLRSVGAPIILYNLDDPTGNRDGRRFDVLVQALPLYDLCAVVRQASAKDFYQRGARKVVCVWRSYDEIAHAPFGDSSDIPAQFRADVAFVGTWMRGEDRDRFLMKVIEKGVDVSIWGPRWAKSPFRSQLARHLKGGEVYQRDYVAAIQGAKICIALLSKGNRDLHTQRSLEIPYVGSVLCGERTNDHLALFREGIDAVFWSDANECAEICKQLLADPKRCQAIAASGADRVRKMGMGNEDKARVILSEININVSERGKFDEAQLV